MKLLAFILAIFFLGLSLVPCADEVLAKVDYLALTFDISAEHDHCGDADFCSPFCLCQCCHNHFTTIAAFIGFVNLKPIIDQAPVTKDNLVNSYFDNILAPPKS